MSDKFGLRRPGTRVVDGGGFYAEVPKSDDPSVAAPPVPAGAIFMPSFATSPQFGVAETKVEAGELGWFADEGTFAFGVDDFAAPESYERKAGQAIYYAPTDAASGAFSTSPTPGSVLLGWEVVRPGIPDGVFYVALARPAALES
ncbi:MAG: hypothetical protein J6K25_04380 [Thermoguttaceae bacterium]|nr:hypothetical protein [Thermoguttaceae bacterium]